MADTLQRERTWEVNDAFVLPNIEGVVADAELHRESTESVAAYYDTADLDLLANGITLRRNDDGDRCQWRLAMPTGAPSIALTSKSSGPPPAELTRLLMAVTSGKELGDVVSVRAARQVYRISRRDDEDSYVVLVDERVFASTADRLAVWREVEVGVGPGIGTIPERLARRLEAAGARPARRRSELEHVLPALRGDDETALHSARKAAKRARYAGELLGAVRQNARRKAKGYKKIQNRDHQDPVVAGDMLRQLAAGTGQAQDQN